LTELDDGGLMLEMEVVAPDELRKEVLKEIERMLVLYSYGYPISTDIRGDYV